MRPARFLIALTLLLGCGSELPDPRIVAITPASLLASDARTVVVSVEGVLPFSVDFDNGMASADTRATLTIGGLGFSTTGYRPDGTVQAFLPSVFQPGAHDVSVRLGDGRTATSAGALTVDPGDWPDAYVFVDPIPDQTAGVPFDVTIRAERAGGIFTGFSGTVNLSTSRGPELSPSISQPFDAGLVTERRITIATPGTLTVVVADANGTTAASNSFLVRQP